MKIRLTPRNFFVIDHAKFPPDGSDTALVQEASAVGDYEDAFERPGSSYLWIGAEHRLNREEVLTLMQHLDCWLEHGRLVVDEESR